MAERVLVGLADSGVAPELAARVVAARAFRADGEGRIAHAAPCPDAHGHGSALARIVLAHAPAARLVNAQLFGAGATASAVAAAAAIDWLVEAGAAVLNLSFGLREDRAALRAACARALAAERVVIAAAPARGAGVFPSSYDGVIRVTGDARCAFAEVSALATAQADFGACVHTGAAPALHGAIAGASVAVAHATGVVAAALVAGGARGPEAARAALRQAAVYHGPERRTAPDAGGA
jgi:hypothetical protein